MARIRRNPSREPARCRRPHGRFVTRAACAPSLQHRGVPDVRARRGARPGLKTCPPDGPGIPLGTPGSSPHASSTSGAACGSAARRPAGGRGTRLRCFASRALRRFCPGSGRPWIRAAACPPRTGPRRCAPAGHPGSECRVPGRCARLLARDQNVHEDDGRTPARIRKRPGPGQNPAADKR